MAPRSASGDVAAPGRSRVRALRTKLLAQITDRVTAVFASGDCWPKPCAMANKRTVLLKYLLAMRRATGRTAFCWFLSFDSRRPTRSHPPDRLVIDEELHFHNRQISELLRQDVNFTDKPPFRGRETIHREVLSKLLRFSRNFRHLTASKFQERGIIQKKMECN